MTSRAPSNPLLALAAVTLALGGCGGGEEPASDAGTVAEPPPSTDSEAPAAAAPTDLNSKPAVEIPDAPPPSELEVEDIVEGDGEAVGPGDELQVQYIGVSYGTGEEFDSSWERGEPFAFQLGAGMVIPGWDEGLEGMMVGGRRRLTIPPDLAYGPQGSPPAIGPNETLVFVIDLVDAR